MASHADTLSNFDPSGVGLDNGNLYGLPFDYESANIIVFGVPWEVTVSYHEGTADGPQAVLQASPQLDLYDFDNPDGWRQGIYLSPIPDWIMQRNDSLRPEAARIIEATEQGIAIADDLALSNALAVVNEACETVNQWLFEETQAAVAAGKRVGVIGGDHSVPLGTIRALSETYPDFGILHIDAHADLRQAYQGFQYSHASIMHNVLQLPQVTKLVQVGVRDICHAEIDAIVAANGRVVPHYDAALKHKVYQGVPWLALCRQIIEPLPQRVYVSFDVDGLDPKLCPNTGTPVPGGLELQEAFYLLRALVDSGRELIGFDVSEVGNGDWDGNVGARTVYKLCCLLGLAPVTSS